MNKAQHIMTELDIDYYDYDDLYDLITEYNGCYVDTLLDCYELYSFTDDSWIAVNCDKYRVQEVTTVQEMI